MKLRSALLPTLIALLASVLAVLTPGLRAPAGAVDSASASGHVYDFDSLAAISGATVLLYADTDHDQRPNGAAIATTTTDASGAWQLSAAPGENILRIVAAGHGTGGTILAMTAAEPVVQDIWLQAGTPKSRVYGDVVDAETDEPLDDAVVTIYADADEDGQPDGDLVTSTATLGGSWEDQLADGSYVATAEAAGFAADTSETFTVTLGTDTLVRFELTATSPATGNVNGFAADALANKPLVGAKVAVYADDDTNGQPDGDAVATTVSDPGGTWLVTLPAGAYVIQIAYPGYETWTSWPAYQPLKVARGSEIGPVQGYLQRVPPQTGHVTGHITDKDTGAAIADATVVVYKDNDKDDFPDEPNAAALTTTDAEGRWASTLAVGSYIASANAEDYEFGVHGNFTVTTGGELTVDIALQSTTAPGELATITGFVGAPALAGATSASGTVEVYDEDGQRVAQVPIASNGAYEVEGLPAGDYRVRASGSRFIGTKEYPYIPQFWSRRYSLATASVVSLAPGAVRTGIDILLGRTLIATARPVVTGRRVVGTTLRASRGTWNRTAGTTFTYVWRRGTTVVGRGSTYRLKAADRGRSLTVTVTARDSQGWLRSGFSATATGVIRR